MIEKYIKEKQNIWNQFLLQSKNGTFLFCRNYMDYHQNRFEDYSLFIYRKDKPYSLLPAHRVYNTLYSHQGLTYGGFIMNNKVSAKGMLDIVEETISYLLSQGINEIVYKPIPFMYHIYPAQEDLYAFYKHSEIQIIGCTISSVIFQNQNKLKYDHSRKGGLHKAIRLGLKITESDNFEVFWNILINNLETNHRTKPVHTIDEIRLLKSRFPENIKLYLVQKGELFLGGTLLYISRQVVHAQYASASPEGKESGALDLLFDYLINEKYTDYPYFDFGHSNEQMGNYLNEQLIFQKEGFGGRGVINNTYKMILK